MIRLLHVMVALAAVVVIPMVAIGVPAVAIGMLARCGRKAICWALALAAVVAALAWFACWAREGSWRSEQGMHIRWNVMRFSDQYQRVSRIGDEDLRHDYVTNFICNACILLNLGCKTAPNTSNLVERYYWDWDERIEKAERKEAARRDQQPR